MEEVVLRFRHRAAGMVAQPMAGRLEVLDFLRGIGTGIADAEQPELVERFERPRQIACSALIESIAVALRVPPMRSVDVLQRQDVRRQSPDKRLNFEARIQEGPNLGQILLGNVTLRMGDGLANARYVEARSRPVLQKNSAHVNHVFGRPSVWRYR